jgi:hypothetical protein
MSKYEKKIVEIAIPLEITHLPNSPDSWLARVYSPTKQHFVEKRGDSIKQVCERLIEEVQDDFS